MILNYWLEKEANSLMAPCLSRRQSFTLTTSKGGNKGSYVNSNLEKIIGKFADMESVDEKITATEIKQRIQVFKMETSAVSQELKVKATGNIKCVSGACVYMSIPTVSIKRRMYIEEDTHTFENGHHVMDLKLSFDKTA